MSIFQSIVYPSERRALCPGLSSRYEPFCGVVRGEHGDDEFSAQPSVRLGAPVVAGVWLESDREEARA